MIKNILQLFNFKEKLHFFGLLLLILFTSLLEMIGVGIIYPYINVIANNELIETNYYLKIIYYNLGFSSTNSFIIFLSISLIFVLIIKNIILYFSQYIHQTFILMKRVKFINLMLQGYLKSPYEYHINNNSVMLWRNLNQVDGVFTGILQPILSLLAEATVVTFILLMMMLTEFELTIISLITILFPTIIMQRYYSSKLKKIGKESFELTGTSSKILFEAFGAIKDIFIIGIQAIFTNRYIKESIQLGLLRRDMVLIGMTPRLFLEPIIMSSLIIVILAILIFQEKSIQDVLPIIALFATAAFRILNSINKIINNLQQLDFNQVINQEIVTEINRFKENPKVYSLDYSKNKNLNIKSKSLKDMLELKNIYYSYPNSNSIIINDISLKIEKGAFIGIVGESGAGKSTLADIILGLLKPKSGQIILDGKKADPSIEPFCGLIGYIPQRIFLSDDSIKNNIAFGVPEELINNKKIKKAVSIAQLESVINEQTNGLETIIGEKGVRLSGGQIQRIGIARALYYDPEIIIMDEATSSLDGKTEINFNKAIDSLQNKKTLIIIAHRMSTVKNCNIIYYIEKGRIIDSGTFDELYEKNKKFRQMAGNQ